MGIDPSLAPLIESADRFAAAARSYLDDLQSSGPRAAAAASTFADFLRVEALGFFRFPWSADRAAGATPPPSIQFPPAIGPGREHQLRWQRTASTGSRVSDAQLRLQLLWADALRDAAMAFVARLPSAKAGAATGIAPGIEALRGLYDSWVDCAEEAYARIAHCDSFCSALAEYMNAGSAWRKESQASIELWAKALDLPTRSELNTLMRRVSLLEEQLRLKNSQNPPPTDPPRARRTSPARRGKRR